MIKKILFVIFLLIYFHPVRSAVPEQLQSEMNTQINHELSAAYTYLAMAQTFAEKSFDGSYYWFTQQFYEEMNHARIIMDFMEKQNAPVTLMPLDLEVTWDEMTLPNAFKISLNLEQIQTERIRNLYQLSLDLGAHEARSFLHFFLNEQVEEEDSFADILDRLLFVENSPHGILEIDKELKMRPAAVIFVPGVTPIP